MKTIAIVRHRGQLTIPDSVRKFLPWLSPLSPVNIRVTSAQEIIISPHHQEGVDWDLLWKRIKRVRAYKGAGEGDLSTFIAHDRQTRR